MTSPTATEPTIDSDAALPGGLLNRRRQPTSSPTHRGSSEGC